MKKEYFLGIDIGSTTVKTVITNRKKEIIYSEYGRHYSRVRQTVCDQLKLIQAEYPDEEFSVCITGSGGLGLAQSCGVPFVQEVHASFVAVKESYPDTDVVIELGGEDAKIIFLTGGVEQRMNGTCAGGTGAFIDQMATLLSVTAQELDTLSLRAKKTYPIASRCGVFAKSDIQPLLNQGATREDVSASIFQAVVDQTVSGLAQGRSIEGKVLFLGGPLYFLKGLRNAFVKTLGLEKKNALFPEEAPVFVAYGCSLCAENSGNSYTLHELAERIKNAKISDSIVTGQPLFGSQSEYDNFIDRHKKFDLKHADIRKYKGDAYLGIDAGSTTTKLVLITDDGRILYHYYASSNGQPLDKIAQQLKKIYSVMNPEIVIRGSAVTGYGEELIKSGFCIDSGIVETVAHFKSASYFCPDVDFIIDIGGQDIKCFRIKNHSIDSIMLNEACSSGCGSFIQTFAMAMGYDIAEFSQMGLFAKHPVELGSRCTVFMNSSVKQAQRDGASVEDISAGLSMSIIKNAVYKVIRANSPDELGKNIVVQGGTFLNDAVLRSFERELGRDVIRPAVSGLMGAFGCALYAKENAEKNSIEKSGIISAEELENFSYKSTDAQCNGCTAHCRLNIVNFCGGRKFVSGNRCDKGAGKRAENNIPNLYEYKYNSIVSLRNINQPKKPRARVGIPLALNFYELAPFWHSFFTNLGFETVFSDESSRNMYYSGQQTIPSDTVCYPAKITHGHIENLLDKKVDFIFYPCMSYNLDEGNSDNHYNCPVVAYYPELLIANNPRLNSRNFVHPYIDLNNRKNVVRVMSECLKKFNIAGKIPTAVDGAYQAYFRYMRDVTAKAVGMIRQARAEGRKIIVLAGRPYHVDKEINHGLHKLITNLGMAVITEDSVAGFVKTPKLGVLNQWTYHSRLYRCAKFVTSQPDMQLVHLVSFGCGIDAVTSDEVRSILESKGKLYTQLKIDEINNLGAVRIRLRSLAAAMDYSL